MNKNPNIDNLKPFQKGVSGNPNGHPKGLKNRSTIAKRILEMRYNAPEEVMQQLKKDFPGISDKLTVEEVMTIIQVNKAITEGDTAAYRSIQDSAYGQPKQDIAIESERPIIQLINVSKSFNQIDGITIDNGISQDKELKEEN